MFLCVTYNHFKMLYLHLGHTYLAYSGLTLMRFQWADAVFSKTTKKLEISWKPPSEL